MQLPPAVLTLFVVLLASATAVSVDEVELSASAQAALFLVASGLSMLLALLIARRPETRCVIRSAGVHSLSWGLVWSGTGLLALWVSGAGTWGPGAVLPLALLFGGTLSGVLFAGLRKPVAVVAPSTSSNFWQRPLIVGLSVSILLSLTAVLAGGASVAESVVVAASLAVLFVPFTMVSALISAKLFR